MIRANSTSTSPKITSKNNVTMVSISAAFQTQFFNARQNCFGPRFAAETAKAAPTLRVRTRPVSPKIVNGDIPRN